MILHTITEDPNLEWFLVCADGAGDGSLGAGSSSRAVEIGPTVAVI